MKHTYNDIYIYNEIYNIINMIWVSNYPNILESNNGKTIDYIIYIIYIHIFSSVPFLRSLVARLASACVRGLL